MNKFVAWGFYPGGATQGDNIPLSYYNSLDIPGGYAPAAQYTIADNFFHSAYGGSWFNAMWLIMAQSPIYNGDTSQIPVADIAVLDSTGVLALNADGTMVNDGIYTPDFLSGQRHRPGELPQPSAGATSPCPP